MASLATPAWTSPIALGSSASMRTFSGDPLEGVMTMREPGRDEPSTAFIASPYDANVDPFCPEPIVSRVGGESADPPQPASRTATTTMTRTERDFLERIGRLSYCVRFRSCRTKARVCKQTAELLSYLAVSRK